MYYLVAFVNGWVNSLMTLVNGEFNTAVGNYTGTVLIHCIGLFFTLVVLALKRERFRLFPKGAPAKEYLGGVIGVGVVLSSAFAYGSDIGVTQIIGLSLTGSTVMSLLIDCFGWFGMEKRSVEPLKILALAVMAGGILFMLAPFSAFRPVPVLCALLCGVLMVLSRSFNGLLTERLGAMQSTLYNYITGLTASAVVMLLLGRGEALWTGAQLPSNPLWYTGGLLGVVSVTILNIVIHRIPALYLTIIMFIGQVAGGFVLDALLGNGLPMGNLIGGLFCTAGMCINAIADRRRPQDKTERA
ncbi:MAG: DMT family transporter [Clostridia bacterium]|nr:DMT family transporter [Clostridia bacterium]